MARGTTLEDLKADLRYELSDAATPALSQQVEGLFAYRLRRTQEWLWEDFDWPHLRVDRDVKLAAGQRYYDVSNDIPFERIEYVRVRWGDVWIPVTYGINANHFTAFDSERDVRQDPVQRWQYNGDAGETDDMARIEVWPIPATSALVTEFKGQDGTLRFRGIRRLRPLVAADDRADLDDRLLVLYAASEILAKRAQKDAEVKGNLALKHYNRLKARYAGSNNADRTVVLGGGADQDAEPHYTDYLGIPRIPTGFEHRD